MIKSAWRRLRANFWGSLAFDVVLIAAAFVLISMWQTRNLPDSENTPPLEAVWRDGMQAYTVMAP